MTDLNMCDHCNNQGLCKCDKEELQEQIEEQRKMIEVLANDVNDHKKAITLIVLRKDI
jgi:hypothetical protein